MPDPDSFNSPRTPALFQISIIAVVLLLATDAFAWRARQQHRRYVFQVSAESERRAPPRSRPATLVDRGPGSVGGFGGVSVGFSPVAGSNGLLVGGEGALVLGHRFSIGGAGRGLVNGPSRPAPDGGTSKIGLGYGGVVMRYHLAHRYPIFPALGTLVGFGGISFDGNGGEIVTVIEPSAAFYVNITRWVRIGFTLSYRWVTGVDTPGLRNADFRGPGFSGHIDFGAL